MIMAGQGQSQGLVLEGVALEEPRAGQVEEPLALNPAANPISMSNNISLTAARALCKHKGYFSAGGRGTGRVSL